MGADLIDQIYEAAAAPDLWPDLLDKIAELVSAEGTLLFVARQASSHVLASPRVAGAAPAYFERGYQHQDERTRRLLAKRHAGFVTDLDVFSLEEWQADPIRNAFWVPLGLGWGIATQIEIPSGENIIIHAERRAETGPYDQPAVDRLDRLRPHLARASLLSSRLAFERARSAVAAVELLGLPAAVIDLQGKLYVANGLFDDMIPAIFADLPGGLRLTDSDADALFAAAVQAAIGAQVAPSYSVPIRAREGRAAAIVHLLPVRGAGHDIFTRAGAIVVVTPVAAGQVPAGEVIQGLFDLTPTEARVARALGQGSTLAAIATQHSVALTTVRNQLREIFAKTGTHRQSDLVGLLQGLGRPPGIDRS